MKLQKTPLSVSISIASVLLGFALFAIFLFISEPKPVHTPPPQFPLPLSLDENSLTAVSAIVYDPTNGHVLFDKNAEVTRPLASLTKLLTAQAVLGNVATNTTVTITLSDLKPEGDWGLRAGDHVSLANLLKFSLVASSNDAMAAAASSLGGSYLSHMDQTARGIGISDMYFLNPTGLDLTEDTSGAYGSAHDVARLAAVFLKKYPEYFELTAQKRVSIVAGGRQLTATSTATPLLDIPGFIGAKTGYTDLAGGNLVAAYDVEVGHPLIAVVLGSTATGRFNDIRTLINASRAAL